MLVHVDSGPLPGWLEASSARVQVARDVRAALDVRVALDEGPGLTAVVRAAREVLDQGSLDYVDAIQTVADFNELTDPQTAGQ